MREFFARKMVGKTDYELRSIVDRKELFQAAAVLAAIDELERRNLIVDEETKRNVLDVTEYNETEKKERDGGIVLIPNTIIILICSLLSPAVAGVPYAINLWRIDRKNEIWIASAILVIFNFGEIVFAFHDFLGLDIASST
jgi:hypothetical protein